MRHAPSRFLELKREAGAGSIPQAGGCKRGLAAPGCP
jgi:hypothetical protein